MSAQQGSYACRITVDRQTADVLREESKLVLVFNHETFFVHHIAATFHRELPLAPQPWKT